MTIDPKDLREGDRVRITLCGEFIHVDSEGDFHFRFDGGRSTWFPPESLSHAEITRLDPPIRVGDRVKDDEGLLGTVKGLDEDEAWVRADDFSGNYTRPLSSLTRIEGGAK